MQTYVKSDIFCLQNPQINLLASSSVCNDGKRWSVSYLYSSVSNTVCFIRVWTQGLILCYFLLQRRETTLVVKLSQAVMNYSTTLTSITWPSRMTNKWYLLYKFIYILDIWWLNTPATQGHVTPLSPNQVTWKIAWEHLRLMSTVSIKFPNNFLFWRQAFTSDNV